MIIKGILPFIIFIASLSIHADNVESTLKKTMKTYLVAMKQKDESALKKIVSEKYFKFLKDSKLLENSFKKQTPGKIKDFDFTFKPFAKEKGAFFVNIKNKSDKFYSDYWFVIKKTENGFKVDSSVFLD